MTLFYLTLAAELALGVASVLSIVSPARRVWPPPGWRSWQFWFIWVLILFVLVSVVVLAVTGWNSFVFPDRLRFFVGLPLFVGGLVFTLSGIGRLGTYNSAGLKGHLITETGSTATAATHSI